MTEIKTESDWDQAIAADIDRLSADPEPADEPEKEPEQAVEPEPEPEPEQEAPPAEKDEETKENPDEPEVVPAPVGWSDEDRKHFATLPPDVQKTILRRESEREKGLAQKSQEFADQKRRLDALDEVLKPHRQTWELNGISEAQALQRLFAAQQLLSERPADGIAYLARQYGVDLGRFDQSQQPSQLPPGFDKVVHPLAQRLEKLESTLTQSQQQQQAQQTSAIEKTIQSWASETDDKGQPLRPHFETVQDHMTALMPEIRKREPQLSHQEMLNKAYDMAVYASPEVRQVLLDAQARSEQARRAAEARHKADKAKKASSSVSGDGGGEQPGKMDIDEAVEAAWAQLS